MAFRDTRKAYFISLHLLATIDDDLFGIRAADNQVITLSNQNADKEWHTTYAVADALFRSFCAEFLKTWRSARGVCAGVTFFAFG